MYRRGWNVYTLDNDRKFDPDECADVRIWQPPLTWNIHPDLIWCSPPCTEFARESMPWSRTGEAPDLSIVRACKRLIDKYQPRYWVIENVRGALKWFSPILGKPAYQCNPYFLWGNFPDISHIRVRSHKEKLSSVQRADRAMIPEALSQGLAEAIEISRQLFEEVSHE